MFDSSVPVNLQIWIVSIFLAFAIFLRKFHFLLIQLLTFVCSTKSLLLLDLMHLLDILIRPIYPCCYTPYWTNSPWICSLQPSCVYFSKSLRAYLSTCTADITWQIQLQTLANIIISNFLWWMIDDQNFAGTNAQELIASNLILLIW